MVMINREVPSEPPLPRPGSAVPQIAHTRPCASSKTSYLSAVSPHLGKLVRRWARTLDPFALRRARALSAKQGRHTCPCENSPAGRGVPQDEHVLIGRQTS